MFKILQEEKWITVILFTFMGISLFSRILLGYWYGVLIRETDNMATTKNKLLKQCKTKFISCFQLSGKLSNVPVFAEKFVGRLSLGPVSFDGLYHLSGQAMLLSVVAAGVGVERGISGGRTIRDILPFYIVCFIGLYLFLSLSAAIDVKNRKQILKVSLVDYLENHLAPRIEATEENMNGFYEAEEVNQKTSGGRGKRVEKQPSYASDVRISKEELEALLAEFLVTE